MRNSYKLLAVIAALLAAPAISFAQSQDNQHPRTRAEVKQELVELEAAGYDPNDWIDYPSNIQAAEQRVAAEHANRQQ